MAKRLVRGALLLGLVVSVARCGDDGGKKVVDANDGGQAGEATGSGGSGDPGDMAGAPTTAGTGGAPTSEAGAPSTAGTGGAPEGAGGGGAPGTGSGSAGESGSPGAGGGDSCVPIDCCGEQPSCEAGWDTECSGTGAYQTCCEPATGISRDCGYASGGIEREVNVCLNDCTSKSYGTSACGACTNDQDPGCDTAWANDCGETKVYCSDLAAGYRLSCVEVGNNRTIEVECLCDPDVPISG